MANWGEDWLDVVNEESNVEMNEGGEPGDYHNGMYEETPCTPPVTEQEYTPGPTANAGQEYTPEPTGDTEREYMSEPTSDPEPECMREPTGDTAEECAPEPTTDSENDSSDTAVPYLDGENETATGGDCFDVTLDGFGTATMNRMNWTWANNVRLVLNSWWQAMVTGGDEIDVPR
jgi:hypothetical protein